MFTHLFKKIKLKAAYEHSQNTIASSNLSSEQQSRNIMWQDLRAALRGDKEAQYKMGLNYLYGQYGLDRNFAHAEKWLDQAAHQGHVDAKIELQKTLSNIVFS